MLSAKTNAILTTVALFLTVTVARAQQSAPMPREHMQHGTMQPVEPVLPRMGRAQEQAQGQLFTLDEAQRLAAESNPTLRQAEAGIRAAKARTQQAGLYPNPSVGYTGDEIRGGSSNGGKQGFFVEQSIVTGGKLAKSRSVFEQETRIAELEAEQQKLRIQNAVKIAYYRVLAAQELVDASHGLVQIEGNYSDVEHQLYNSGQADESEVLEAEVGVLRVRVASLRQENSLREEWKSLAAVIGRPDLPQSIVAGDLANAWPEIDEQQVIEVIATQAPATRIADTASSRGAAEMARAKSQAIPDLNLLGGLEYNNEPLGNTPRATGWEGLAELSVQIPIFNRNQGNISEASAALDRSQLEKQRIQLVLRERAASLLDRYDTSKVVAAQYRGEILPRATKAYALLDQKYGLMLASYPRVLEAQRKLFTLHAEYLVALETTWTTGIALQGFLLTDGLEAPSSTIVPLAETNTSMPRAVLPSERMPLP
jgi:cobalt-zinc-cadmium efflux system outer membrane protein